MANNRLFLYDPVTKESVMIAKSLGDGWYSHDGISERLNDFFEAVHRDGDMASFGSSNVPTRIRLVTENENPFEWKPISPPKEE